MNTDLIRVSPSELDEIYKTLLANNGGERSFNWETLEQLPLPSISIEYDMDRADYCGYKESYEFHWFDETHARAYLLVCVHIQKREPIMFTVIMDSKDGKVAFRNEPIWMPDVCDEDKDILRKPYTDNLVTNVATWVSFPSRFLNINGFLRLMQPEEICDIKTKATKEASKSPRGKAKKHKPNKVKVYKVYRLKSDWKDILQEHRHNIMSCPAWGVRGHYRHYKDGRVIWVKAYVKGKDRTNYQGKEYQLFKEGITNG